MRAGVFSDTWFVELPEYFLILSTLFIGLFFKLFYENNQTIDKLLPPQCPPMSSYSAYNDPKRLPKNQWR